MDLQGLPGNEQRPDSTADQFRERGGMLRPVDTERIRRLMQELGSEADQNLQLYLAGGATAVLHGWRPSTAAVDIKIEPESDGFLRSLSRLKSEIGIPVQLASPDQFIPEIPGWRDRSCFIAREGRISFYHYDYYAQALSKLQRGHAQDLEDVWQMLNRGLIEPLELQGRYNQIEPFLFRFPAIDPPAFRRAVAAMVAEG